MLRYAHISVTDPEMKRCLKKKIKTLKNKNYKL